MTTKQTKVATAAKKSTTKKATTKNTPSKTAAAKPKATKPASVRAQSPTTPPKAATEGKPTTPRKDGTKAKVLAMISQKGGATLPKIMEATGWQAHSVRGLMATLGKTMKIESLKNEAGQRTYIHHA